MPNNPSTGGVGAAATPVVPPRFQQGPITTALQLGPLAPRWAPGRATASMRSAS